MEGLQETAMPGLFQGKVNEELVRKLPFWINVLGGVLIAKCQWIGTSHVTGLVTFGEILEWLTEKIDLDVLLIKKKLKRTLRRLLKKGLIVALTAEEASREGIRVPGKARKVYGLSGIGEELMRFVNPYMDFFFEEILVPVSFNRAIRTLRLLLGRREFLSPSSMKKICLVKHFGKTTVVLKKLESRKAYKIFPELPFVSMKEFIEYLRVEGIPLTDEIMQGLERAFGENEKVRWHEIAYVFQN